LERETLLEVLRCSNLGMRAYFDELEREGRLLPLKPKAALARVLIEELGAAVEADSEQLWVDEAQPRYDAYLKGELEAIPGDDVMKRARSRVAAKCL
jgi:hypothetical protein